MPVPDTDKLRVRLSFVVDNWKIDWVALSPEVDHADARAVPLARITTKENSILPGALENASTADRRYVVTRPGDVLRIGFDVGTAPQGRQRTLRRVYHREQLRLLSRFPQGLSPPLLEQLLAAEGQTGVDVISRK